MGGEVGTVLVYGFGPYAGLRTNVAEQVVRGLRPRRWLTTRIFEVRFSRAMLLRAVADARPAVILGLGQHSRARKLRVERRACNRRAGLASGEPRPIESRGPTHRYATLELPVTSRTTVTYDAGTYVCNFSMYVLAGYCEDAGARFGFVHVPMDYSATAAASYVEEVLSGLDQG